MSSTIDLEKFVDPDMTAADISNKYQTWENLRNPWLDEKKEIQEYIFATDTMTTTNSSLPWKNKVHIPKLCQIRDNLHANYMATLFPSDSAIVWEGDDTDAETHEKRVTIQSYMTNKLKQSGFRTEVSRLVLDYIDYGNVFAMPVFEASYKDDPQTGEQTPTYIGPRLQRIAPENIVFDPTATHFEKAPKIVRELRTLGSLKKEIETVPELAYRAEVFDRMLDLRGRFAAHTAGDFAINSTFQYAGFTGFWEYFNSGYVELLNFYGDFFDVNTGTLYENYLITVVDKAFVIRSEPLSNWTGSPPIRHAGWRVRQNNLYAMGPLDNLVGLQYRIDHLENAKADAFDLIVHPVMKVKGYVEDFEYGPGERIYVSSDDGDVEFMQPDTTFLQADTQIAMYENKMEEMAGAPKQAVGFRTPGEKTAYEVQVLENGANRVFINKISDFEEKFLEPLLNDMLELARRNFDSNDVIRVMDDETQAVTFETITKEDIVARGKIRPIGARHFAQNATIVQNLTQFANSNLARDPLVMNHISGQRLAIAMESLLGLEKYKLVQPFIRLSETAEMQNMQSHLQQAMLEQQTATMDPQQAAQVAGAAAAQQAQPGAGKPPSGPNVGEPVQ
jgi:hypothetical protein